jgi:hypothetical protein
MVKEVTFALFEIYVQPQRHSRERQQKRNVLQRAIDPAEFQLHAIALNTSARTPRYVTPTPTRASPELNSTISI